MSEYLATFDHLKFSQDGGSIVVTSWRDSGFEQVYPVPDDLDMDDDVASELFDLYYTQSKEAYNDYK